MPRNETHLDRKLRELGMSPAKPVGKKHFFKLYFPRPPHGNVEYKAAKMKDGYNFVGLLLGHGGATLQRIQRLTGTKIEIHDSTGNLNGAHPSGNDPTLHARIVGDSKGSLAKAVQLVAEALQPLNTTYERLKVDIDGSGLLKPVLAHLQGFSSSLSGNSGSIHGTESENSSFGSHTPPESLSPRPGLPKSLWSGALPGSLVSGQPAAQYYLMGSKKSEEPSEAATPEATILNMASKHSSSWSSFGGATSGDLWSFQPEMGLGGKDSYGSLAWPSEYSPFGVPSPTSADTVGVYNPLAGLGISLAESLNTMAYPMERTPWSLPLHDLGSSAACDGLKFPAPVESQIPALDPSAPEAAGQQASLTDPCIDHLMELLVAPNSS